MYSLEFVINLLMLIFEIVECIIVIDKREKKKMVIFVYIILNCVNMVGIFFKILL